MFLFFLRVYKNKFCVIYDSQSKTLIGFLKEVLMRVGEIKLV